MRTDRLPFMSLLPDQLDEATKDLMILDHRWQCIL